MDERQAAQLKRRSERSGSPARRDAGARAFSMESGGISSSRGGRTGSYLSESGAAAMAAPSADRHRASSAERDRLLRAYSGRPDSRPSSGSSVHRRATSPSSAAQGGGSLGSSGLSSTSAAAVAIATRRGTSSARGPRDINILVDKLLSNVHGSPSAIITRRTVLRLHDSVGRIDVDPLSMLEKIKRKITADSPLYYDRPHEAVTRLNELYSRFVRYKNVDKKPETMMLFYGLMDSVPAPLAGSNSFSQRVEAPSINREKFRLSTTVTGNTALAEQVNHSASAVQEQPSSPFQFVKTISTAARPPTVEVDSLEDSFKFAVGVSSAPKSKTKPHRRDGGGAGNRGSTGVRARDIEHIPRGIQEQVLLRDVLYALQAIDSHNIYFDQVADQFQVAADDAIPSPMRKLIHRLCELGWLYRKISAYITFHRQDLAFGVVGQSFCHVLNTELVDYFRLIAVLSAQVDEDALTRESADGNISSLTLRNLLVWTQDPLDRLRLMARLIDSVEGIRGGALASGIHSHVLHGDPDVSQLVRSVIKRVASPIFRMIKRWVFEGELEDAHAEFFVVADRNVDNNDLWAKKYTLNVKMLPTFIPVELARKILVIGKSINFIRQCCGNADWMTSNIQQSLTTPTETPDDGGVHFAELTQLEVLIESVSNSTNAYLIRTLMDKYKLVEHLQALKRFLLLGQGDFIQYLMDLLGPELSKRGASVYRHTLTNVLETALNASNAKFESQEVLKRLDVELLEPSAADSGWDIFCLHYRLDAPVNSVINDNAVLEYQKIFDFLWRLKRTEFSLSASWTKDMNLGHMLQGQLPGFRSIIHRCQLLRAEMIHFTTNLHNYMMFEVLETAWHTLVKSVNAAKDLDELIESHRFYIASIRQNGFMTRDSREIMKQMKLIFGIILKFCKTHDNLYTTSLKESQEAEHRQQIIERRTLEGTWGTSDRDEYERSQRNVFGSTSRLRLQIEEIANDFNQRFTALLEMVKERPNGGPQSLPFLVSRFDFNEYYYKKSAPARDIED